MSLYTSEQNSTLLEMEQFFRDCIVAWSIWGSAISVDRPLSREEVAKVISALQTHNSPGPDGFPVEFYKTFSAELVLMLLNIRVI